MLSQLLEVSKAIVPVTTAFTQQKEEKGEGIPERCPCKACYLCDQNPLISVITAIIPQWGPSWGVHSWWRPCPFQQASWDSTTQKSKVTGLSPFRPGKCVSFGEPPDSITVQYAQSLHESWQMDRPQINQSKRATPKTFIMPSLWIRMLLLVRIFIVSNIFPLQNNWGTHGHVLFHVHPSVMSYFPIFLHWDRHQND